MLCSIESIAVVLLDERLDNIKKASRDQFFVKIAIASKKSTY
jgi:hypothetical protein